MNGERIYYVSVVTKLNQYFEGPFFGLAGVDYAEARAKSLNTKAGTMALMMAVK